MNLGQLVPSPSAFSFTFYRREPLGISGVFFFKPYASQPAVSEDWRELETLTTTTELILLHSAPDSWGTVRHSLCTSSPLMQLHCIVLWHCCLVHRVTFLWCYWYREALVVMPYLHFVHHLRVSPSEFYHKVFGVRKPESWDYQQDFGRCKWLKFFSFSFQIKFAL